MELNCEGRCEGSKDAHATLPVARHSQFGVGVDWPISYADLEPWYVKAEHAIGVAGDNRLDQGSPRSANFPMPPVPTSYLDKIVGAAAQRIGLRVEATPQARNTETFNDRHHCVGNSNCIPIGAKYDALVHLDLAVEKGAQLVPNAVVRDILLNADGTARGVVYRRPDGTDETVLARGVVLAANAIESPKILLMSNAGRGVANSSDMVGRNLMETTRFSCRGRCPVSRCFRSVVRCQRRGSSRPGRRRRVTDCRPSGSKSATTAGVSPSVIRHSSSDTRPTAHSYNCGRAARRWRLAGAIMCLGRSASGR